MLSSNSIFSLPYPIYCEKTRLIFAYEPLNALSSISFFITAYFIFRLLRKNKNKNLVIKLMFYLTILIGVGSTLWHASRNPFALLLDALPILILLTIILYSLISSLATPKLGKFLVVLFVLIQVTIFLTPARTLLNGTISHFISFLISIPIAIWVYKKDKTNIQFLMSGIFLYGLGILFRYIDLIICNLTPLGTHFLWHFFNSISILLIVRFLVLRKTKIMKVRK